MQTRIRGINVDVKRANAHAARKQFEQHKNNLSTLEAEAQAARSQTEQIQDSVNAKVGAVVQVSCELHLEALYFLNERQDGCFRAATG